MVLQRSPYERYQVTRVMTASTGELVVMLYEGAVRSVLRAQEDLRIGSLDAVNENLIRAQEIVLELYAGLDLAKGGALALSLRDLYLFMHRTLVAANVNKDAESIRLVARLLTQLRDAWRTAVRGEDFRTVEVSTAASAVAK